MIENIMECKEVGPEIEAYAIGALPLEEMKAIDLHLKSCPACRALLEQYNHTLESLALEASLGSAEIEPPDGHKERFLNKLSQRPQLRPGSKSAEEIAEERQTRPQPQPVSIPDRPRTRARGGWWGRLVPAGFALMLMLVVGLGLWSANLQSELDRQTAQNRAVAAQVEQQSLDLNRIRQLNDQLTSQKNDLSRQISTISTERDNLKQEVSQLSGETERARTAQNISLLLTRPGATTRTAVNDNNKAGVTVLMAPTEKDVALFAHSWPKLQEGQEYRVWLYHTTGALISAGSLKLNPLPEQNLAEALINVPEPMSNYTVIFITIEQTGAQKPGGPELVRDKLA